jgi:uncharacterized protein (TIGR02266 family)
MPDRHDDHEPYRRSAPRLPVELEIGWTSENNFFSGFAENISEGGVFLVTYEHKEIGERVKVLLTFPGNETPLELEAEVRWHRAYDPASDTAPGWGLRFVDLSDDARTRIEAFVKQRDPIFYEV